MQICRCAVEVQAFVLYVAEVLHTANSFMQHAIKRRITMGNVNV